MNTFFYDVVENLNIQGYKGNYSGHKKRDTISDIIQKFKKHPSLLKVKEVLTKKEKLFLANVNENGIATEINDLNTNKPATFKNIPAKLFVKNCEICTPHICNVYDNSILTNTFPENLKMAYVIPADKKITKLIEKL